MNKDIESEDYFALRHSAKPYIDPSAVFGEKYMAAVIPTDLDNRIIDLGCGYGQNLYCFRNMGYNNVFGIDLNLNAVTDLRNNNFKVQQIDLLEYLETFQDEKFHLVILSHVLEHLEKNDSLNVLKLIYTKLLLPGGSIFIQVPNAQSSTGCYWAYEDFTHYRLYTSGSISYSLKFAGFDNLEFLDPEGFGNESGIKLLFKKVLLYLFKKRTRLWNYATSSTFHGGSPEIYTYDLKVLARRAH